MRRLRALLIRLHGSVSRGRADTDFEAELQSHLQLHIDDNLRAGMTPDEARRAALLKFGPLEAIREDYRDRSRLVWVEAVRRDVAFGFRMLLRQPGFAAAAIVALALGIGANAAVFSVVDALVLRPLPYPQPDRIVHVKGPSSQSFVQFNSEARQLAIRRELRESPAFSAMGFYLRGAVNLGGEPAERIRGAEVTAEFFDVLGIPPSLGRTFTAQEVQGEERVAVIADRLWRERFAADPSVPGREILLDGVVFRIIGVMPNGVDLPDATRVWVPNGSPTQIGGSIPDFTVLGRLAEGLPILDARLDAVRRSGISGQRAEQVVLVPLREMLAGRARPIALFVWAAAALVLLIACLNTANLLLARVTDRHREFAIRRAIGATPRQLAGQVMAESLVLALLGALAALPAAVWSLESIRALLPLTQHGVERMTVDGRVVGMTAALAAVTAVLFGLGPALSLRARGAAETLHAGRLVSVAPAWRRFRSLLLVGEVAIALALLVGAVTLVNTVRTIMSVDTGVRGEHAIAMEVNLPRSTYTSERRRRFFAEIEAALQRLPGVVAAGITNELPGRAGALLAEEVRIESRPVPAEQTRAVRMIASPGYFAAAGIDLISGRYFEERDSPQGQPAVIVSEGYARILGVSPANLVGARAACYDRRQDRPGWAEIVGVVRDVRMRGPEGQFYTAIYVPAATDQGLSGPTQIVVRGAGEPKGLVSSIRAAFARLDPALPLYNVQTFDEITATQLGDRRFATTMMVVFAALGCALAVVGLYGVVSYLVHLRRREIGIRLAIGASRHRILREVLLSGVGHAVVGIVLGILGLLATHRAVSARLAGFSAIQPEVVAIAAVALVLVAAFATWIPAVRATRIDPAQTLRAE